MINLTPNKEKKKMIKDFYLRLVVVFIMMLGVSVVISSFALIPSYLFSIVKKRFSEEKLVVQKNIPLPEFDQQTLALIGDLNSKLNLIENSKKDKFLVSDRVINKILSKKMTDIKINKFSYKFDTVNGKIIGVQGTAPSRERLLLFKTALEEDSSFTKVDLPISNFIRGSNIQFNLNLVAK